MPKPPASGPKPAAGDVDALLESARRGEVRPAYLLTGDAEQPLRDAAHRLANALVAEKERSFNLSKHDGATVRAAEVADDLCSLSLLGGRRVVLCLGATFLAGKKDRADLLEEILERWEQGREDDAFRRAVALCSEAGLGRADLGGRGQKGLDVLAKAFDVEAAKGGTLDRFRQALAQHLEKRDAEIPPPAGGVALLESVLREGRSAGNVLVVTARKAERTLSIVKLLREIGAVVSLDSAPGRAQDEGTARALDRLLVEHHLRCDTDARTELLARLPPDPERIAREIEKLAAYVEMHRVDLAAVDALVAREREDPIYELTGGFAERDLARTIARVRALLDRARDPTPEAIRIVASLAGELRRLIRARAAIDGSLAGEIGPRTTSRDFESRVFPRLSGLEGLAPLASSHPFRAYRTFLAALRFGPGEAIRALRALAALDRDLKSRPTDAALLLERYLVAVLPPRSRAAA